MPDAPDFRRLFDSLLSPLLVLSPDFVIVEVNRAYLTATRTDRGIVGRPVFDVFPDNPGDPTADGVANLRRSLETVVASGRTDTMALQRYDIPTDQEGVFAERYWSPVNAPVLDDEGRVTHVVHRVEDVTEFVHLRKVGREQRRAVADAQMRAEGMEIDLFVRAREIREVNEQLSRANAELDAAGRFYPGGAAGQGPVHRHALPRAAQPPRGGDRGHRTARPGHAGGASGAGRAGAAARHAGPDEQRPAGRHPCGDRPPGAGA